MNMDKPKFLIKEFLNNIQISNNEQISKLLEVHLSTSVKNVESQNLLKTVQDKINMTEHKNQEFLNNSDVVQNKIKNNLTLKHEILKNHLKHHNIMMKDYADYNIILIYTNYNIIKPTNLQRECRSIIIDRNTFNIIAYTCEIPIVNKDGFAFLHNIYNNNYSNIDIDKNNIITSCYEGTLCAIFHYNNKWYLSTRKNVVSSDILAMIPSNNLIPQFIMFNEIINLLGYTTLDEFCFTFNKNYSYYYIILHHKNKNLIDYSQIFGNNYMKLCLIIIRDQNMIEQDIYNNSLYSQNESEIIFVPPKNTFMNFNKYNDLNYIYIPPLESSNNSNLTNFIMSANVYLINSDKNIIF